MKKITILILLVLLLAPIHQVSSNNIKIKELTIEEKLSKSNIESIKPYWTDKWIRSSFQENLDIESNKAWSNQIAIDENEKSIYLSASSSYGIKENGNTDFKQNTVILKYDFNGNIIWNKILDEEKDSNWVRDIGLCVYDSNIYVSYMGKNNKLILSKIDKNRNLLWTKKIEKNCIVRSIKASNDYIYITGGETNVDDSNFDLFILKYNTDGVKIWEKNWKLQKNTAEMGNSILVNQETFYVLGYVGYADPNNYCDIFLTKYDINGNIIWTLTKDLNQWDMAFSFDLYNDNLYIVGVTGVYKQTYKSFLIKYDADGNLMWPDAKTWEEFDGSLASDITIKNDQIFIVGDVETSLRSGFSKRGLLFLKYDLIGNLIFAKAWPRPISWGGVAGYGIDSCQENLYIVGEEGRKTLLLKCNFDGESLRIKSLKNKLFMLFEEFINNFIKYKCLTLGEGYKI